MTAGGWGVGKWYVLRHILFRSRRATSGPGAQSRGPCRDGQPLARMQLLCEWLDSRPSVNQMFHMKELQAGGLQAAVPPTTDCHILLLKIDICSC